MNRDRGTRGAPAPPTPRRLDQARLEQAAQDYIARYASSADGLRRVLRRKVERAARAGGCDRAEAAAWVEPLVARFVAAGLVDDRVYAEAAAASLRRRGASARGIRLKLAAKGVDSVTARGALAAADGTNDAAERAAALAFARRRRLGPFAAPDIRRERRLRDLAALARAGFDGDTARRIIDGDGDISED